MSESAPAYVVTIHQGASKELDKVEQANPEAEEELLRRVEEAAKHRWPADHPCCVPLTNVDLLRIKCGNYRALCRLQKPQLQVLVVENRRRVYDDRFIELALERAEDGGS